MKCISICCLLFFFLPTVLTDNIDFQEFNSTNIKFCAGEKLILVCRNDTSIYTWRILPVITGQQLLVSQGIPEASPGIFNASFISNNESRLEFVATRNLNNTTVVCFDVLTGVDFHSANLQIHGDPVAPTVDTITNANLSSFLIRILSPDPSSVCFDQYNVSLRSDDLSVFAVVPRNYEEVDASMLFNKTFQLCKMKYSLTVVASIGGGVSNQEIELNYQTLEPITGDLNGNIITLQVPESLEDCITYYNYIYQGTSGTISPINRNEIRLGQFNFEPCINGSLLLDPIILGQAQQSLRVTIEICGAIDMTATSEVTATSELLMTSTSSALCFWEESITLGLTVTLFGLFV